MANKKVALDNQLPGFEDGPLIDPAVYNGIAKCAQLLAVQLIESEFHIHPNFFEDSDRSKLHVEFSDVHGSFDEDSRVTTCIFQFECSKKEGRKKVFSVKDKFVVFYRIPIECDDIHAVAFANKTGLMACYPYFRSHVSQTASLANAEMPILPTIASMPVKGRVKKESAE